MFGLIALNSNMCVGGLAVSHGAVIGGLLHEPQWITREYPRENPVYLLTGGAWRVTWTDAR